MLMNYFLNTHTLFAVLKRTNVDSKTSCSVVDGMLLFGMNRLVDFLVCATARKTAALLLLGTAMVF